MLCPDLLANSVRPIVQVGGFTGIRCQRSSDELAQRLRVTLASFGDRQRPGRYPRRRPAVQLTDVAMLNHICTGEPGLVAQLLID